MPHPDAYRDINAEKRTIKKVPHIPGLGAYVVIDGYGAQMYPKPGTQATLGACQRFIEREGR